MKKLLLTGIAVLLLATGTMQAKTIKGSSDYPQYIKSARSSNTEKRNGCSPARTTTSSSRPCTLIAASTSPPPSWQQRRDWSSRWGRCSTKT